MRKYVYDSETTTQVQKFDRKYQQKKQIDAGSYGTVFDGTCIQSCQNVAIKHASKKRFLDEEKTRFVIDERLCKSNALEHLMLSELQSVKGVIKLIEVFELHRRRNNFRDEKTIPYKSKSLLEYIGEKHFKPITPANTLQKV